MKRILVLGNSGSGKSTFSRKLGEVLKIPVIHLDRYFWQPYWVPTQREEWQRKVEDLLTNDSWIIDGNYNNTLDIRLPLADTAIYLEISLWKNYWWIFLRLFRNLGRSRPDVGDKCREQIDWEFIRWIWNFNRKVKPEIMDFLSRYRHIDFHILRTEKEKNDFFDRISNK